MLGERAYLELFWKAANHNAQEALSSLRAFWQLDGGRGCKGHVTFSVNRDLISIVFPSSILFLLSLSLMSSRWNISGSISLIEGHYCHIRIGNGWLGLCGSVGVSSCAPGGHRSNSYSGLISGLQNWSMVRVCEGDGDATNRYVSLALMFLLKKERD